MSRNNHVRRPAGTLLRSPLKVMGVPDRQQVHMGPERVQMPVRSLADPVMMGYPRCNASGTKGTANANNLAGSKGQSPLGANLYRYCQLTWEYLGVAAVKGFHPA